MITHNNYMDFKFLWPQIKPWSTATCTHLHLVELGLSPCDRGCVATKLKILSTGPFTEKVCCSEGRLNRKIRWLQTEGDAREDVIGVRGREALVPGHRGRHHWGDVIWTETSRRKKINLWRATGGGGWNVRQDLITPITGERLEAESSWLLQRLREKWRRLRPERLHGKADTGKSEDIQGRAKVCLQLWVHRRVYSCIIYLWLYFIIMIATITIILRLPTPVFWMWSPQNLVLNWMWGKERVKGRAPHGMCSSH